MLRAASLLLACSAACLPLAWGGPDASARLRQERAELRADLASLASSCAPLTSLSNALSQQRVRIESLRVMLPEKQAARHKALGQRVIRAARRSALQIDKWTALPRGVGPRVGTPGGAYEPYTVELQGRGSLSALCGLLRRLEYERTLHATQGFRVWRTPDSGTTRFSLQISSYRFSAGAPAPAPAGKPEPQSLRGLGAREAAQAAFLRREQATRRARTQGRRAHAKGLRAQGGLSGAEQALLQELLTLETRLQRLELQVAQVIETRSRLGRAYLSLNALIELVVRRRFWGALLQRLATALRAFPNLHVEQLERKPGTLRLTCRTTPPDPRAPRRVRKALQAAGPLSKAFAKVALEPAAKGQARGSFTLRLVERAKR